MTQRFPRPRGDGPGRTVRRPRADEVSPPTRGWTRVSEIDATYAIGFPAHAGMDPSVTSRARRRRWFPRPRGDGPFEQSFSQRGRVVSPPTRGWTQTRLGMQGRGGGFPAHAGMDPSMGQHHAEQLRFPRPRGDGPAAVIYRDREIEVSPPTRGWTNRCSASLVPSGGFPAHAGMDRPRRPACRRSARFPRPRGDGPLNAVWGNGWSAVSPPTRGWTAGDDRQLGARDGFPAHAGMDRVRAAARGRPPGFPRPRGDGPTTAMRFWSCEAVSPPTRGWTAQGGCRR